ncbi:MAG: integrase arm-type DNA-binding domain-containing protein [Gammaproteobacteria bacterium]|nr:integrase arm-type DNA-binding domain-containing protein [Gammaproteobacteria bacterium]
MRLTDLHIKALLSKPGKHRIDRRLYLLVKASGAASWSYRYLGADGKAHEIGLGGYPDTSLARARAKALELTAKRQQGIDPAAERRRARGGATFQAIAERLIAAKAAGWRNAKHAQQWRSSLRDYAYPVIGRLDVDKVTVEHVLKCLRPIWTEKPETASRLRQRIEAVLDAATAQGLRTGDNPARWRGCLQALLPPAGKVKRTEHHPALPYERVAEFFGELGRIDGMAAICLRFVILTACRSGEARFARWREIDMERGLWTIPAERMKAGREHIVPLSDQALALLRDLPRIEGCDWVFPSPTSKPMSDMALTSCIRRMDEKEPGRWIDPQTGRTITVHGFRATFRNWAGEATHHPREVIEHALAHQIPDKAEAAYARGTLLEKRRRLMQDWGDFATQGHKVIDLASQKVGAL